MSTPDNHGLNVLNAADLALPADTSDNLRRLHLVTDAIFNCFNDANVGACHV